MSMAESLVWVVLVVPLVLFLVPLAAGLACALVRLAEVISNFIAPLWLGGQAGRPVHQRWQRELVFAATAGVLFSAAASQLQYLFDTDFRFDMAGVVFTVMPIFYWRKKAKLRGEI